MHFKLLFGWRCGEAAKDLGNGGETVRCERGYGLVMMDALKRKLVWLTFQELTRPSRL